MSHSPESETINDDMELLAETYGEPDRIPYDGPSHPGVQYTIIDQDNFTTTHKDFLNRWYQIRNSSMEEAKARVKIEKARNKRIKEARAGDSQGNGLFRLNAEGIPIRAAASTDELFIDALADSGLESELEKYNPGSYITYGKGENGSNEMAALSRRSPSIVVSAIERDRALAKGTSLEEAQAIGAITYSEQERFRAFNDHTDQQPEALSVEPVRLFEKPQVEPSDDAEVEEIIPEDNPEENERSERRSEAMKKWFQKIGHDTTLALKTINGVGTVDTIRYGIHTVTDGLSPALEKTQKILETIQSSPDNLSKEFRAAKDTIKLTVKLLKIIWEERQFEARKRKSIKYQEKLRLNSVDQVIVDARIAKIFVYLGQKHPETVLYSLYDSTPKH